MRKIYLLFTLAAGLAGCVTEDQPATGEKLSSSNSDELVDAVIVDEGEPMWDGCGWVMYVDSVRYKPLDLPDDFKVNGLGIKVSYAAHGTDYLCGLAALPMPEIEILSIKKD
ncbi:MAG: hypothetical protein U0U09_12025 [Cyclobacteriaceae bacterium]